jgi:hypothetical protein
VFFRQSDFPRAAQYVTRSTPPLTIKVTSLKYTPEGDDLTLSVKFLRNVGKGLTRDDIKELVFNYKVESNQVSYKNIVFNKMNLNTTGFLIVNKILLFDNSSLEKSITSKYLKSVRREY